MGNICSKLCNPQGSEDIIKSTPQDKNNNLKTEDKKKVFQSSYIQNKIKQKLKRPSGIHFKNIRNKFSKEFDLEQEKPCRSKEDLRHIYKFLSKNIGEGGFGYVCKACLRSNPEMVYAIKQVNKNQHSEDLEIFLQEIELMKVMDHPHIVKFFQVYEDEDYFYMVLEYLDGGELIERMEEAENFDEEEIKNYFWQMLLAVRYMNKRRIAHRDIKPENFMFKDQNGDQLKLIDFGLSQAFQKGEKMSTLAGSPYYLAPEVLKQEYTHKCDVWSLGVILYEMITGDLPFFAENNNELFGLIQKGVYDTSPLDSLVMSDALRDLLGRMIVVDDVKRISIEEALNHEWFENKIKERLSGIEYLTEDMLQNMRDFTVNSHLQREMIGLMVQSFQEHDEIETLKMVFNAIDTDYSGTLQKNEIMKLYLDRGIDITEEEVEDIIDSLYIKEEGIVTFLEFIAANLDRNFYAEKSRLRLFFNFLDIDNSGEIEADEISDVFKRFGRNLSDAKINAMIKEVDKNSDKKINFEEFIVIMNFEEQSKNDSNEGLDDGHKGLDQDLVAELLMDVEGDDNNEDENEDED